MKNQKKIMLSNIEIKTVISALGLFADILEGFEPVILPKDYTDLQTIIVGTYNKLVPEIEKVKI